MLKRHSLCFLFSGLPLPDFCLLTFTSAKPQVQHFVSRSKDSSMKTPSLSAAGLFGSLLMTYFTYIGRSLKRSRSSGIRTILSTPGEDTSKHKLSGTDLASSASSNFSLYAAENASIFSMLGEPDFLERFSMRT
ncbi:hypothetical protein V8G54_008821 [Vigna mungo]|uniref:Uncharacterized protein n=1 Tax=Vigna mungo TaxID=3915 RepID=A0AAQ3SAD8_VIGMU